MSGIPAHIDTATLAKVMGYTTQQARRWLKRTGYAEKHGGRWCIRGHVLRREHPDVYSDVCDTVRQRASENFSGRPKPQNPAHTR